MDGLPVSGVLAIAATADLATPEATEFLRVLAALRALDRGVVLVEAGDGVGTLTGEPELTVDGARYLEALVEDGVTPLPAGDIAARIDEAADVLVLANPSRTGIPSLVRWDEVCGLPDAVPRALAAGRFVRR